MNVKKILIIAELIFVVGALTYIYFSSVPKQIYPLNSMVILEPDFEFEVQNANEIVLSRDGDFNQEIILHDKSSVVLPPGIYYWKARGSFRESVVQNFTVENTIILDLGGNNTKLVNSGNVDLNVSIKNENFFESIFLRVGEFFQIKRRDMTYEGKQSD